MGEQQTYDPVLSYEELPKWRLTSPVRSPQPGRALVLVRESGPSLTVRNGEEIPSSRFGAYSGMFTVDLTEHRLVLDIPLLSRDHTFSFRSRVDLVCRVADPAQVVDRGIRDMSETLFDYLRKTLREVSREYDIAQFHQAEVALNATVAGFTGDDAVRLRAVHVELLVDDDEIATSGRDFRDVVRETRLAGMRRTRHVDMIREEGLDGLIAEIMEKEGPRAALTWIEKNEAEKREVRQTIMRLVLERGDADREPFEQAELERTILEEVLREGDGLFDGAARRGRLRGSLARPVDPPALGPGHGPEDEPRPRGALRGEVVRDDRPEDDTPGPTRPGRSRISGTGRIGGSGRDGGSGTGRGYGYGTDAGAGRGYGTDSGRGAGYGTDSGRGAGYGTDSGRGAGYGTDSGRSGGYGTDSGRGAGYGADSGRGAGYGADSGSGSGRDGARGDVGRGYGYGDASGYGRGGRGAGGHGAPEDEPLPDPSAGRGPRRATDRDPAPAPDRNSGSADRPGTPPPPRGTADTPPPRVSRVRGTTKRDTPRPGPDRER
ncbi:hypothetical protein MIU24_21765 [Streptomyces venezuelae]|uniref:hypothetical protein n=1 Tax=Streptomyces sp. B6(2022) TaxID=3404749 RepID=UPI00311E1347